MVSAVPPEPDADRAFADALAQFETALREVLEREARRSIDAALARLPAGQFDVRDVAFDVVIRNLTLSTSGPQAASRPHAAPKPAGRRRGRPQGPVRTAILASFDGQGELDTSGLKERLVAAGVATSSDNLHQQLRRLTASGELVRAGRGVYRRR